MKLSLFGAFKANRRSFLRNSLAMTLALPLATKAKDEMVLELNGFTFGQPKFKIGDRVGHEWFAEKWDNKSQPPTFEKVYEEGLIIGYLPNCEPETWHQQKYAGQWAYHICWTKSSLKGKHNLGIDYHCQYFEEELTLAQ